MRILYIYRYAILGGVMTQLVNRYRYLSRHCDVSFVFLRDHGGHTLLDPERVRIIEDGQELSRFIRENGFELIINIDTDEAYEAILEAGFSGPLVHEVHGTSARITYLRNLLDKVRPAAFITPSRYVAQVLHQEYGLSQVDTYVVPNCLDVATFQPSPTERDVPGRILLWVGKLNPHKNWLGFLRVAARIKERRPDVQFWVVGGETAGHHTVYYLLSEVYRLGLGPSFKWIERVEYSQMPHLYALAATSGGLSVSTSQNESFGMSVIESLACGCLCIAPRVGALPEVLTGELSACLYSFFDEEELVERILLFLEDDERRNALGRLGQQGVAERFAVERVGEQYLKTLQAIVAKATGKNKPST